MENSSKLDINKDVPQLTILQKINKAIEDLGIDEEWVKAPEFLPEYESLKGKRIVMVDDVKGVIANILPEYIVATDGNANAVLHVDQSLEELVAEILVNNPEIVLMDYSLANNINGIDVVNKLKTQGYTGKVVGQSSEGRNSEFKGVGAIGCINKTTFPASKSVKELIKLLENK